MSEACLSTGKEVIDSNYYGRTNGILLCNNRDTMSGLRGPDFHITRYIAATYANDEPPKVINGKSSPSTASCRT